MYFRVFAVLMWDAQVYTPPWINQGLMHNQARRRQTVGPEGSSTFRIWFWFLHFTTGAQPRECSGTMRATSHISQ